MTMSSLIVSFDSTNFHNIHIHLPPGCIYKKHTEVAGVLTPGDRV